MRFVDISKNQGREASAFAAKRLPNSHNNSSSSSGNSSCSSSSAKENNLTPQQLQQLKFMQQQQLLLLQQQLLQRKQLQQKLLQQGVALPKRAQKISKHEADIINGNVAWNYNKGGFQKGLKYFLTLNLYSKFEQKCG